MFNCYTHMQGHLPTTLRERGKRKGSIHTRACFCVNVGVCVRVSVPNFVQGSPTFDLICTAALYFVRMGVQLKATPSEQQVLK